MIYNIKYTNLNGGNKSKFWKKTLYWKQTINDKGLELWSGNENEYNNTYHIHGTKNIFSFGHNGIEANSLICLYAGFVLLSEENILNSINYKFIDDIINNGIDLYQAFANTESGKRIVSKTKTLHMDFYKVIDFFNNTFRNINYYDTSIVEFSGVYTPDFHNYDKWINDNISFFTDKSDNTIGNYACIILSRSESFCLIFIDDIIYFFDPIGRGRHFFDIPNKESQYTFVHKKEHKLFYSNENGYILRTDNYDVIKKFLKNTISIDVNNKSIYIKLRYKSKR